jgi:hypothetical protein
MKKNKKTILFLFLTLFLCNAFFVPLTANAATYTNQEKIPGASGETGCLPDYIKQIIGFGFATIGILALCMLCIGAYQYLMAAGNIGKVESAKETIASALLGLVLGLTAWLILQKINPDLVSMSLDCNISNNWGGSGSGSSSSSSSSSSSGTTSPTVSCASLNASLNSELNNADNGVPPALLASFMKRECSAAMTNPEACGKNNSSGAGGPMQFTDPTWAAFKCSGSKFNRQDALNCAAKKIAKDSGGDYSEEGIRRAAKRYCGSCTNVKACGGDYCDGIVSGYNSYKECFK